MTVEPIAPLPEKPMSYVGVAHPDGLDWNDIRTIFLDKSSPARESLKNCEEHLVKLIGATEIRDEISDGAIELVQAKPDYYHWCFYSKLLELDERLKKTAYIDEKQKQVIQTFSYLVPLAKAFQSEFQDTRYLRWAISRYRRLSENVFYRRVELTPQMSQELAMPINPFGLVRPPQKNFEEGSVLSRYGIVLQTEEMDSGKNPVRTPAMTSLSAPVVENLPNEERVSNSIEEQSDLNTAKALDPSELKPEK